MVIADSDVGVWASVGAVITQVGFSGFVAWFLLTKALPKMQEDFTKSLKELQEKHDQGDRDRRTDGKAGLDAVLVHCERETLRRDRDHEASMSAIGRQLTDFGEILEDVRTRMLEQDARRRARREPRPPKPT